MKRGFGFLLVFIFFLCTTKIYATDNWLELNTANFWVCGNVEENELLEIGEKLETFHQSVQGAFQHFQLKIPFRSNVVVLRGNSNSLKITKPFIFAPDTNYLIFLPEKKDFETNQKIFHEYTHFLINNNFGQSKIPVWLNEGLSEFFSNKDNDLKLLSQQENNLLPLRILLETDNYTLHNQTEERKAIFNAQSQALLNFLIIEKSNGEFVKIERFIEQLIAGKQVTESFITVFQMNFNQLENEFRQFLTKPKLFTKPALQKKIVEGKKSVSKLNYAKSLAILGDYFYYSNQINESINILEESLKINPNESLALSTLSLIKAKSFYYAEAERLAEKAIQNEPENFLNFYRFALCLSRQGMTEFGFVSGYSRPLADKMREALLKAISIKPEFTESYALLAFINYVRNENLDETVNYLNHILKIAPGNQTYLIRLAEISLRKENFSEARQMAMNVFRTAPDDYLRLYSQNTIQRIDSTEYQLERIRNDKLKYVNEDLVTEKPLSEEEIKKLREKAIIDQIKLVLRRPKLDEIKILATLVKIECRKEKVDFIFKTPNGIINLRAKSLEEVSLISYIEEMSDYRLGCGAIGRENNASIIYKKNKDSDQPGELLSIEFIPNGFKLQN